MRLDLQDPSCSSPAVCRFSSGLARHRRDRPLFGLREVSVVSLKSLAAGVAASAFMLGLFAKAAPTSAANIWLSGVDPEAQKGRHVTEPADYMDLFKPDAPWKNAASSLAVFKVGTRFALHADDAELRTMIDDLKRRHIAFAVELGVLESSGPGFCGYGVEGYG